MKELEKAKYNITLWEKAKGRKSQEDILAQFYRKVCKEHKRNCERWLKFLKSELYARLDEDGGYTNDTVKQKKKDLNDTIKFYEKEGIE